MDKDEKILIANIEDKARRCRDGGMLTHTGFLSMSECALAADLSRREALDGILFGGYEDAERRVMFFVPEYWESLFARDYWESRWLAGSDSPLAVLRVSIPKGSRKLTHRDYLGSILALGVERSVVGDILVRDDGADVIILREMADFFLTNLVRAGRDNLSCSLVPIAELDTGTVTIEAFRDTVASLRLDNIVSSVFKMSRGGAQEAIHQGLVSLNNRQTLKPDAEVREGDKIVCRGKGKAVLKEIGGRSRKDRIAVTFDRYK